MLHVYSYMEPRPWARKASCDGMTAIFYPPFDVVDPRKEEGKKARTAKAKEICRTCPVLKECQSWVLEYEYVTGEEPIGIIGGMTESERKRIIRTRRKRYGK